MPVKVLNSAGNGSWADIASGIDFASTNGAKVISMSLGGSGGSATLQTAVDNAWANGVLVVAAAGNSNTTAPSYPAYYSNCIAVASTTNTDARSSFSNYGPWVDVAAPGSNIYSTYLGVGYTSLNGTSMACPHVAGLGGLLWSYLGVNTPVATIRQRIENNCDPVGNFIVHGRVNALKALTGGASVIGLSAISANPRVIHNGQRSTFTVTLSRAAPTGGALLLISTSSRAASIPSSIRVPAGRRSATFFALGLPTTTDRRVDVTVSSGSSSVGTSILVKP
jgi:subtilisin family serine protease